MIAIYTAMIGPKSVVKAPLWISDHVKYYCFTDQADIPKPWITIPVQQKFADPTRDAKIYKLFPHKFLKEDVTMWIDSNFEITSDPTPLFDELKDHDIVMFKHFERYCLYDEAEAVKKFNLDDFSTVVKQMERYTKDGFPKKMGLTECGVILRRNTLKVRSLMEKWNDEIVNGSRRDQLSFMYVVWKLQPFLKVLDMTSRRNPYVKWHKHLKSNDYAIF